MFNPCVNRFCCWAIVIAFVLFPAVLRGDAPAVLNNTAGESVTAAIQRVYLQSDYSKALDDAENICLTHGRELVWQNSRCVPVYTLVSSARKAVLTQEERKIYQARYESIARSQYQQAEAILNPEKQMYAYWNIYQRFPYTQTGVLALDNLAQYCYFSGDFASAKRFWTLLSSTENNSEAILSQAELQARLTLCEWETVFSSDRTEPISPEEISACEKRLADFRLAYSDARGRMGGKNVLLTDFLAQRYNDISKRTDNHLNQTQAKPEKASDFLVDARGLVRFTTPSEGGVSEQKKREDVLFQDLAPATVKRQYRGAYELGVTSAQGLVFARIGTPEVWQNPNQRAPLELRNRLVCLDTRQGNIILWETLPADSLSRWASCLLYDSGNLYAVEVRSGIPNEVYLCRLDAASGLPIWRKPLFTANNPFSFCLKKEGPFAIVLEVKSLNSPEKYVFYIDKYTGGTDLIEK